jgi:hypothetical protein
VVEGHEVEHGSGTSAGAGRLQVVAEFVPRGKVGTESVSVRSGRAQARDTRNGCLDVRSQVTDASLATASCACKSRSQAFAASVFTTKTKRARAFMAASGEQLEVTTSQPLVGAREDQPNHESRWTFAGVRTCPKEATGALLSRGYQASRLPHSKSAWERRSSVARLGARR